MGKFILRRLGASLAAVIGVVLLVFVLARLIGKPGALFLSASATQEQVERFNQDHGFNGPILQQLGDYLARALHLDFGQSLLFGQPALQVAIDHFAATLQLTVVTLIVCVPIGILLGSIAAYNAGGVIDKILNVLSAVAVSIPNFWLALLLILVLSIHLHLLPPSGTGDLPSLVMPVIILSVAPIGLISQVTRNSMREALRSEYVVASRAKGMTRMTIVRRHALRNAAIPIVTISGIVAASMVNGVLIVETVFAWPGIGYVTLQAVTNRDFALLQACVIVTATAVVLVNLLVDLLYGALDPRVSRSVTR